MKQHKDQYPDSDQLRRKYARRAKIAAWTAGIPGIFGGIVAMEAIHAQPAAAMQEAAPRLEQSPQAFIDSFDKNLAKEVQLMRSSPHFTSIRHEQLSKIFHTEITIDYVGAPSKQYPGRLDWLAVLRREGKPLLVEVLLGSPSRSYKKRIHAEFSYLFGQGGEEAKFLPKSMSLHRSDKPRPGTFFNVSAEGYPAPILPESGVKYSDKPDEVSAVYSDFLSQIHSIATRK